MSYRDYRSGDSQFHNNLKMATATISVKNTGNQPTIFYYGLSFGAGLGGVDCNSYLTNVIYDEPIFSSPFPVAVGATETLTVSNLPDATIGGQAYVLKVRSSAIPTSENCLAGARVLYIEPTPVYGAEINSFTIN